MYIHIGLKKVKNPSRLTIKNSSTRFDLTVMSSLNSVQIPNALGTIFGLIQLILYGYYYRSTPKKGKNVELPTVLTKNAVTSGNVSVTIEK